MRIALLVTLCSAATARPQPPRLDGLFPMGAKIGTTVEVTLRGAELGEPVALRFAHPGVTAKRVEEPAGPPNPKDKKTPPPPAVFRVTVAADVPPGGYDARVVTAAGVSNPRLFTVGRRLEVSEAEPNDDAVRPDPGTKGKQAQRAAPDSTVNGVLAQSTDVDYVVVAGKAGQRLLAHCAAPSIDSRAVPFVEIFTADGRQLAASNNAPDADALADARLPADGDYFVRVSVFAYQGGGPDDFYRLTVGSGPWVDAVVPPVVAAGRESPVTVYGRNLPGGKPVPGTTLESVATTVTAPHVSDGFAFPGRVAPALALSDGFEFRLPKALDPDGLGNAVPLFLSRGTPIAEPAAVHGTAETAAVIAVPGEVVGQLATRNERDFYKFTAKKGEVLTIDAAAERLGAAVDLRLRVRDANGRELAGALDDDPDALHPAAFPTRCGDPPAFRFTAPADGPFTVLVTAADGAVNSGPRCTYSLRVAPPSPDFRAVAMPRGRDEPRALNLHAAGDTPLDVFVDRRDGFDGPVTLTATNLPAGVSVTPVTLTGEERWAVLAVRGTDKLADGIHAISVTAVAEVAGKRVTRTARPATVVRGVPGQPNAVSVARLTGELVLATRSAKAPFAFTADAAKAVVQPRDKAVKLPKPEATRITVYAGDKFTLPVGSTWAGPDPKPAEITVTAEPTHPDASRAGLVVNNNQALKLPLGKADGTVPVEVRPNAKPGDYLLTLRAETPPVAAAKDKPAQTPRDGTAEPITVTVLPTKK